MNRRKFLSAVSAALAASHAAAAEAIRIDEGGRLFNPCGKLSDELRRHPLTQMAFDGLRSEEVWDCHAHLLGKGHGGTGAFVNPKMQSIWALRQYIQYRFYLGAACVTADSTTLDRDYVARLTALLNDLPTGYCAMLMAFDRTYDEAGRAVDAKSAFHLPNGYAAAVANANPQRLRWTASVHPYRSDAAAEVARAAQDGAVAVKWLPPAMGIDPASARCDAFYAAMAKFDLPLITHGGEERAVEGAHQPLFGNVLKLRRPLERGVRVVVAHCASLGRDIDTESGDRTSEVDAFALFERLMREPAYVGRLFGDISATPQTNRFTALERILRHRDWDERLLNGSDYPLPGVFPLFSVDAFTERGWITPEVGPHLQKVREANPLLFDFLLKRHLRIDGAAFSTSTFETARVFRRKQDSRARAPGGAANDATSGATNHAAKREAKP